MRITIKTNFFIVSPPFNFWGQDLVYDDMVASDK